MIGYLEALCSLGVRTGWLYQIPKKKKLGSPRTDTAGSLTGSSQGVRILVTQPIFNDEQKVVIKMASWGISRPLLSG
jgi:hypothetical protein